MAGGFGLAVWAVGADLPPGAGYGSWRASTGAVIGADGFAFVLAACAGLLFLVWAAVGWLAETACGLSAVRLRGAVAPVFWGASLPALSLLLDAFCFWPTAAPLAALGIGLGALAAGRDLASTGAHGSDATADGARIPGETAPDCARLLTVAAAVGFPTLLLIAGWSPPSGDEPHYLTVAHSLAYDRDLDVADDYGERVYAPYHPAFLSPHYRAGSREGSRYSMHGIGLPLLLAPAYALGRALDPGSPAAMVTLPRLVLVLLYGLFAWILYGFIKESATACAAGRGTAATVLFAPLLFAPLALFTEVPAMLLSLLVFRGARRPTGASWGHGLALAALPFLGVKYIPLAAALLLVAAVTAAPAARRARLARLGLPFGAGLAVHGLFTWTLYGSLSPAAIYLGAGETAGTPALGGDWTAYLAAWPTAMATAVGYFLDQKEGLLAYGPHFLLAFAGLAALGARQRRTLLALAFVAAAYLGPYALSQQLGGQGPPVRPLMAVLWTLAPALGVALARPVSAGWGALRGGLLGLSAALTVAYASQPELLPHDYPVVASRLLQQYSPHGSGWWRWFPQWVNVDFPNVAVTAVWTLAVAALAVALWRHGARRAGSPADGRGAAAAAEVDGGTSTAGAVAASTVGGAAGGAGLSTRAGWRAAAAVFALACVFALVHHATVVRTDRHRPTEMESGLVAWLPEQLPPVAFAERGGVWATPGRPVGFLLLSPGPLGEVAASLRVLVPTAVAVSLQGTATSGNAAPGAQHRARLRPGAGAADDGRIAYHVRLWSAAGAAPADIEGGEDERFLGVLLQLTPLGR